jgi:NAD(P)-dependent dehydrogenase (short-subunit alcohol dehydrogenase family)
MAQLSGKAAIVTGGASGIGEACAETLAREGAAVLITDVDDHSGKGVVGRIVKAGGKARYLHHDVRDEAAWPQVIVEAERNFGRLGIMVANAGIGVMSPIETMTLADWQRQQAINLDGVFLSIKHAIPAMKRAGGGSIVLMSSIAGLRGAPGLAGYSATKGGVRLLAKSVALEHADDNIRCNSVHPGIIATPIWNKIPTGAEGNRRKAPTDPRERAEAVVPLTRVGEAQDIANGVLFLCTDAASYMTGQELVIDGGMTAGEKPQMVLVALARAQGLSGAPTLGRRSGRRTTAPLARSLIRNRNG